MSEMKINEENITVIKNGFIKKVLELKGDKEFLPIYDQCVCEGGGEYKGYYYMILFIKMWRCGYVELPPFHPWTNTIEDDDYSIDIHNIHGGVTYVGSLPGVKTCLNIDPACGEKLIGFDVNHSDDGMDFESVEKYGLLGVRETYSSFFDMSREGEEIKDYQYCVKECKEIINQLIDVKIKQGGNKWISTRL